MHFFETNSMYDAGPYNGDSQKPLGNSVNKENQSMQHKIKLLMYTYVARFYLAQATLINEIDLNWNKYL